MKITDVRFEPGGGHAGSRNTHWAFVIVNFKDHADGDGNPQVRIDIPINFSADMTMKALRDKVQVLAAEALSETADALSNKTWTELKRISVDAEKQASGGLM